MSRAIENVAGIKTAGAGATIAAGGGTGGALAAPVSGGTSLAVSAGAVVVGAGLVTQGVITSGAGLSDLATGVQQVFSKGSGDSSSGSGGKNLNSDEAVSDFGVYEIEVKGELHKVGKADLQRVTKKSGLPTRLHQQVRELEKTHGKGNVQGAVVENLGETTTKAARAAETARLRRIHEKTGKVPPGNIKSFKP